MEKSYRACNTKVLAMSAVSLSLSALILYMFRGPASLISALLIPSVIVLFARSPGPSYYAFISTGLLIVTLLYFQPQIFFVLGYIILSVLIKLLLFDPDMKLRIKLIPVIIYIISVILVLFAGILMTEYIFLVPLHSMMLRFSGNNPLFYFVILVLEGVAVSALNTLTLKAFISRIRFSR